MLKKLTATGIVTVATAGAMMVATPAFAGDTNSPKNGLLNLGDVTVIVPALNNVGLGLLGTGVGNNTPK